MQSINLHIKSYIFLYTLISINQSINQSISNNPQTVQIKTGKIFEIVYRLDDINESIFTFNAIELDYFPNTHFTNTHEVFVI